MKRILVSLSIAALFGCTSGGGGGSNTSWIACKSDADCSGSQVCVAQHCVSAEASTPSAGGGPNADGGANAGGRSSAGGSGGAESLDGGGPRVDASVVGEAGADASASDGSNAVVSDGAPMDGSRRDASTSCNGSWQPVEAVGGAAYTDTGQFGDPPRSVFSAADGSAFTAWAAYDATGSHVYAHASRYTPAGGWVPYLQFDEYENRGAYGGSTPAVAVSKNGEAMVIWRHATGTDGGRISYRLLSMRYASGWEAPVQIEGPTDLAPVLYTLGADGQGNFVAAWIALGPGTERAVRMTRYARGSGWGTMEVPPPSGPDGGRHPDVFNVNVSSAESGNTLVVWSDSYPSGSTYSISGERFDPKSGWSGKEPIAERAPGLLALSAGYGVIGNDGSAAVTWTQADQATQVSHPFVRTFAASWSSPTNLAATTGGPGISYYDAALATDSHGTFMAAWGQQDGTYASRFTAGSWSEPAHLSAPVPDGSAATHQSLISQVAMSETGDAIASWSDWNQTPNTYTVDVATYSPSAGWTSPTRLDTDSRDTAPPLIDVCGNATLVWASYPGYNVVTARRAQGGYWTSPSKLGTEPGNGYSLIAASTGPSGETFASWRASDDHSLLARVWR